MPSIFERSLERDEMSIAAIRAAYQPGWPAPEYSFDFASTVESISPSAARGTRTTDQTLFTNFKGLTKFVGTSTPDGSGNVISTYYNGFSPGLDLTGKRLRLKYYVADLGNVDEIKTSLLHPGGDGNDGGTITTLPWPRAAGTTSTSP